MMLCDFVTDRTMQVQAQQALHLRLQRMHHDVHEAFTLLLAPEARMLYQFKLRDTDTCGSCEVTQRHSDNLQTAERVGETP